MTPDDRDNSDASRPSDPEMVPGSLPDISGPDIPTDDLIRQMRVPFGTPGGATIITSVFQTIMNIIDFDMTAQQAVHARKTHSQWQPDFVMMEKGAGKFA